MVRVDGGCVDIRVSWVERIMLAERSRRIPLACIRSVDPHPPLLEMMVHWNAQNGLWASEVSTYHGHMIPSALKPTQTLALRLDDPEGDCVYVQLDDDTPEVVAERIEHALQSESVSSEQAWPVPKDSELVCASAEDAGLGAQAGSTPVLPLRELLGLGLRRDMARLGSWLVSLGSFGVLLGTTLVAAECLPGLVAVGAGLASCVGGALALALVTHQQN
jgi:hypothetical protein